MASDRKSTTMSTRCDVSVSQKHQAESGPLQQNGSSDCFRWEGLVLGSNRVIFCANAPVSTTEREYVDSLNQQESG